MYKGNVHEERKWYTLASRYLSLISLLMGEWRDEFEELKNLRGDGWRVPGPVVTKRR